MSTAEQPYRAPVTIPRERGRRRVKVQFREYEDVVERIRELARTEVPQADGTGNDAEMCRRLIKEALEARGRKRAARKPLFSDG